MDQLPSIQRSLTENVFKIYDAQGQVAFTKKARSASYVENFDEPDNQLSRSLSYFYAPSDDKGNSALMIEVQDKDDDQWLYLKGLRKPKRVLGSDKSSSFMGSDFSNGDVSKPALDEANYTWLSTEKFTFKGKALAVEKVQASFKDAAKQDDYGYSKTIAWVHVKSGLVFKAETYNLQGQLYKEMLLLSFKAVKNRDGKKVYMATGLQMRNLLTGTKTEMLVGKIQTGAQAKKVKPEIFSLQYLTRKWWWSGIWLNCQVLI